MANLLITGASGFVGRSACLAFSQRGFSVRAFSRTPCKWPRGISGFNEPCLSHLVHSSRPLEGVDCILHLAGRAHVMKDQDPDPLSAYRLVNVSETLKLAREASMAGVKRFVFVSSIKVNGELACSSLPFTESDKPNPADAYGFSKYEAELGLREIAASTGIEVVIVRPPLVYGPAVKGNFRLIMKLLANNIPLPFASITENRRSLVSLDNLIDFLVLCACHPRAANRTFLVSDQHDLSTAELLRRLGVAMELSPQLFSFPKFFFDLTAKVPTTRPLYQKLCGSLVVDSSLASRLLGWSPQISLEEGLSRAARGFVA